MNKKNGARKGSKRNRKVSIAMIGAGRMANKVHYPALASFDDVTIAAICDHNPAHLNQTADRYGVTGRYTDYQKMIEEVKPDGVYAIGHPQYFYDIWVWCLKHGQNLYIEKPMGITRHQADILAFLADQNGCITQVSHQRRTCPLLVEMKKQCLERGPITHAVCEFFKSDSKPYTEARDHMLDDCTHSIDTIRWMCGGNVIGIDSRCRRVGTPDINWIGAMIHFDNGSTGLIVNSWCSGRRIFRVQMHAPGIYCDAEVEGRAHLYHDGDYDGVCYDTKDVAGSGELFVFGGFQAKNREFIDSLKAGKPLTSSPFSDCRETMIVAHKILANALQRGE